MLLFRPPSLPLMLLLSVLVPLPALSGCTPSLIGGGFDSPMAASRLYAIEQAVREGDTSAIRNIIEQLESDDPAVRMMAIGALERLTARTYGYHHEDPLLDRRRAIRRWREAYESGELDELLEQRAAATSLSFDRPPAGGAKGGTHG